LAVSKLPAAAGAAFAPSPAAGGTNVSPLFVFSDFATLLPKQTHRSLKPQSTTPSNIFAVEHSNPVTKEGLAIPTDSMHPQPCNPRPKTFNTPKHCRPSKHYAGALKTSALTMRTMREHAWWWIASNIDDQTGKTPTVGIQHAAGVCASVTPCNVALLPRPDNRCCHKPRKLKPSDCCCCSGAGDPLLNILPALAVWPVLCMVPHDNECHHRIVSYH
jgi:hypothetical protein